MKKTFGKILVVMITALATVGLMSGCGGTDTDTDADTTTATVPSVTVYADAQLDGSYALPYQQLTVTADTAENYGYADSVDSATAVSALDVLVAMHIAKYGDAFTADTCNDYLAISDGWIGTAFENTTANWSVLINGEAPHGDTTSEYGGYEALTVSQAEINDGDVVEVVCYQDTTNYSDNELWLMQDGAKVSDLSVTAGEEVALTVEGYGFCLYGAYGTDEITSQYLAPVAGVQLAILNEDGSLADIDGAVSDSDGAIAFTLPDAGTYTVVAYTPEDAGIISFYSALTVTAAD